MFINKTFAVTRPCVLDRPRTPETVITAGLSPYIAWLYMQLTLLIFAVAALKAIHMVVTAVTAKALFVNNGHTHTVLPFISMIYHNKLYILVAFLILIRIITSLKHNLFSPKTRPVCALDGFNYD